MYYYYFFFLSNVYEGPYTYMDNSLTVISVIAAVVAK